jgi:hypothetical protein
MFSGAGPRWLVGTNDAPGFRCNTSLSRGGWAGAGTKAITQGTPGKRSNGDSRCGSSSLSDERIGLKAHERNQLGSNDCKDPRCSTNKQRVTAREPAENQTRH